MNMGETETEPATANNAGTCKSYKQSPEKCKSRKEYLMQTRVFHPDKNTGWKLASTNKFKDLGQLCQRFQQGGSYTRRNSKISRTKS